MQQAKHDLKRVCAGFELPTGFVSGAPYGSGHINDTYCCVFDRLGGGTVRYILQRVNHNIFKDVPKLMDNIRRVTSHVRAKLRQKAGSNPDREALTLVPARDGQAYWRDPEGNFWRAYVFIEGARTYDITENPAQAREAARAFGNFQKQLMDLQAPRLHDTIPNFHHTRRRFEAFQAALAADAHNRAASAKPEIAAVLAREAFTGTVVDLIAAGKIPERVTHNDTKINNVMLDDKTGAGVCVIDLDTVMPGSVLYDFGDQVRSTTTTAAEDERDLGKVDFSLQLFEELAAGYLEGARDFLVSAEVENLAIAGILITFENGIRFLTDYLNGDTYFKTHRPGQNLDRTRAHLARVQIMEHQTDAMRRVVDRYR